MNNRTIDYYNSNAAAFAAGTENADMSECRERFLGYMTPGEAILDAGCGRDMIVFRDAGYKVSGFYCLLARVKMERCKTKKIRKEDRYEKTIHSHRKARQSALSAF